MSWPVWSRRSKQGWDRACSPTARRSRADGCVLRDWRRARRAFRSDDASPPAGAATVGRVRRRRPGMLPLDPGRNGGPRVAPTPHPTCRGRRVSRRFAGSASEASPDSRSVRSRRRRSPMPCCRPSTRRSARRACATSGGSTMWWRSCEDVRTAMRVADAFHSIARARRPPRQPLEDDDRARNADRAAHHLLGAGRYSPATAARAMLRAP